LRGSYKDNKAKIFSVVLEHTRRTKKTNCILGGSVWTLREKKPHEEGGTALEGDAQRGGEISISGGSQAFARQSHG